MIEMRLVNAHAWVPMVICDTCGEQITGNGAVAWWMDDAERSPVLFTHKGSCVVHLLRHATPDARMLTYQDEDDPDGVVGDEQLPVFLHWLIRSTGTDMKSAAAHARLLAQSDF